MPSSLVELLRARAEERPDKVVYAFSDDGTEAGEREASGGRLSLAALDLRARSLAAWMQARGLEGQRVLLVFPPGLEFITAFFGCIYAGAVAVPSSTPRPNRPMNRLAAIIDDARPSALLTTTGLLPSARQWLPQIPALADMQWLGVEAAPSELASLWRDPDSGPETLAFLQYTSGSTAVPKGVMVSHGSLLHNSELINQSFGANEESRGVFWLPLFHDMGLIGGVLQTLFCGGTSTLMSPILFLQRPSRWLEAISRTGATISGGPNFAYDLCARKVTDDQKASLDLSRWTVAFNGAEPVRAETLERFAEAFTPYGFRREAFLPCYGLAESTLMVTGKRSGGPPMVGIFRGTELERNRAVEARPDEDGAKVLVSSGRTFDGLRVEVVDPERSAPRAEARVGEIWVSGPSVAFGYWNRSEASAETFEARLPGVDSPFLRTGDLGFFQGGELYVTGRIKDLMIVRGRNVYPQDVEWSAAASHPLARAEGSAAFAVVLDKEERLVVVQEIDRLGKGVDPMEVVRAIRGAVAEQYDLDVHAVCLIKALSLPKTSSGKVQRHACREAFLAGTLDTVVNSVSEVDADVPVLTPPAKITARPSAEIERWLVDRLAKTLGMDSAAVDVRRPFAQFGLGSLQAVTLAGDLEAWLGRPLSPTLVYDYPTVEALTRHLAGTGESLSTIPTRQTGVIEAAEPMAIVGIGCRFPGADGPEAFWKMLSEGVDSVGDVPHARRGPGRAGAKRAGFLDRVDLFDAAFFGIAPREAEFTDPQQRLLLEVVWEALEDAGLAAERLRGRDVGVFVGISSNDYGRRVLELEGLREAYAATGNALSVAANRVSYAFDFRGPSLAIDTACSSSLVALHLACESLRRGEASLALAAGVSVILSEEITDTFAAAGFLAKDGRCKAFDASADGYVRGEGAGVVVLKPLASALADGDPVYAVVRGSAVNQDGRSNGLTAPNRDAQESVLRAAYQRAGVRPGEVDYVEAHGTGTLLGDPIEAAALAAVVGDSRQADRPCAIGSVKTNIGHLEAASGIAGVIKLALAIDHKVIPPSLHFREPNPHIPFDQVPIRVQTTVSPWPDRGRARLAGVSSFGFGGTNAHVVLASAPDRKMKRVTVPSSGQVVPISAQSPQVLIQVARSLRDLLSGNAPPGLADVAHTAGARRTQHEYRLAIVAHSNAEAVARLDAFLLGELTPGRRSPSRRPKCAFVFSGQGSQWCGMGRGLVEAEPIVRDMMHELDARFGSILGWSIMEELAADKPRSRLDQTGFGQPVVFALQIALTALWRSWGIKPDVVVGHSLGEVAAAHAAGALGLDDAVLIVAHRARLMQTTAGGGKTAAVALPAEELAELIASDSGRLALACINSPSASVVSGETDAVLDLVQTLKDRSVFAKLLVGDCAFHSPQMEPIRDEFRAAIAGIRPRNAAVPIVSSVTGRLIDGECLGPDYWAQNLRETVRFADAAACLAEQSHDVFLEIGPHPALGSAMTEVLKREGRSASMLPSLRRGEEGRDVLLHTLAALYGHGFPIAWSDVVTGGGYCRLPRYPFQRERFWIDLPSEPVRRVRSNGNGHTNGHGDRQGSGNGQSLAPVPHDDAARTDSAGFLEIEWTPRELSEISTAGEQAFGTWVVFQDEQGLGSALVAKFRDRGARCVAVSRSEKYERVDERTFRVNPEHIAEIRGLLDIVAEEDQSLG